MADPKTYKTAAAFRAALEQRMVLEARTSARPIDFVRKRISFERFLARIFTQSDVSWALKGGYRLELSLHRSRTTKDVDLVLSDITLLSSEPEQQSNAILDLLQAAAGLDLGDYFSFQISLRELMGHATVGGARFTVRVLITGREFDTFRLDVGLAETQKARLIPLKGQNWLAFAGIDSPTVYAINDELRQAMCAVTRKCFSERMNAHLPARQSSLACDSPASSNRAIIMEAIGPPT